MLGLFAPICKYLSLFWTVPGTGCSALALRKLSLMMPPSAPMMPCSGRALILAVVSCSFHVIIMGNYSNGRTFSHIEQLVGILLHFQNINENQLVCCPFCPRHRQLKKLSQLFNLVFALTYSDFMFKLVWLGERKFLNKPLHIFTTYYCLIVHFS